MARCRSAFALPKPLARLGSNGKTYYPSSPTPTWRFFEYCSKNRAAADDLRRYCSSRERRSCFSSSNTINEEFIMSKEDDNKAIVGRWFTDFWGKTCNLGIVDELAAPDMLLQYSLHEPRRGRDDIKGHQTDDGVRFPDLRRRGTADLV